MPGFGPAEPDGWAEPVDADTRALLDGLAASYAAASAAGALPFAVEELPPGPELAGLLARHDVSQPVDGYDVVEAVAAWERLAAWVAAGQAKALAELASRAEVRPAETGYRSVDPITNSAVVVAGRCRLTARQAEYLVGHAVLLVEDFPDTWAALLAGLIDLRRARVVTDELGGQDPGVRRRVEAAVLPRAALLDSVALHKLIKRLLHELAPVEAAERHAIARESRYVAVTAASDGMAHLEALLRAEDAMALDTVLTVAAADATRADAAAGGPVRTKDQRRADALAELGWAALAACAGPASGNAATGRAAPSSAVGTAQDRAAPELVPGRAAAPGNATTGNAAPTSAVATATARGRAAPELVPGRAAAPGNAATGNAAPTSAVATATARGRAAPEPAPNRAAAPGNAATGQAATGNAAPTSAVGTATATVGGPARRRRPVNVHVTIPFGSLIGLSDEPGELDGYGFITAQIARTLAAEGVWTWLTTDPGTGHLLDLGRTRYRPTKALADFVAARDRTCRTPGCHRPARACDLDHIEPFTTGGSTCAANCHALCRTHHLLKHHANWTVTRHPDGTTRWTSPTGHTYERPPERIGPVDRADPPG
ncbi:HNH endonuclease signature motif containing protein [Jiangella ureilytica]|uniref:HNH endonuclease signature motif containing protein n=1 Tax=Jiangella ureilytica TaxID=2530374 RepID=UPI0013A5D75B|nr:HNH endonuclease signature motif containing protein [Jiangella ureilytica]